MGSQMWFTSVYLKTLRDFRWAILGWGLGLGAFGYVEAVEYNITATPEAKASLASLGPTFAWYSAPISLTTPGGMTNWRIGPLLVLLGIWSLLASTRTLRGEEERTALDVVLAKPHGRIRVALEKLAALVTTLLVVSLLIAAGTYTGGRQIGVDFGVGPVLLVGVNAVLIGACFAALGLLISQFTDQRSTAAGVTGGLLFVFVVMDMAQRVFPHTEWIGRLSPVYYYNLSKPLITGYGANPGAMLLLAALTVLLGAVALALFARRDVGRAVRLPRWLRVTAFARLTRQALPEKAWSLRSVYLRSLRTVALPAFWWTVTIAGFAVFMALEVRQAEKNLASIYAGSPFWVKLVGSVGGGDVHTNANLLSFFYVLLPLLTMAFAVTQVHTWATDEDEGRLELELARPMGRVRLILSRFAGFATATVIIGLLTLAAIAAATAGAGLGLDTGNMAAATLSVVPLGLLIAAVGYLLAGWLNPGLVTGVLTAFLVVSYAISNFGPTFNWPDVVLRLSVLYYYGRPLVEGLPVWSTVGVVGTTVLALVFASIRFERKDIAT
jgi:ABC-2 type transport system permease protein